MGRFWKKKRSVTWRNLRGWRRPHDLCRVGGAHGEVTEGLAVLGPCVLFVGCERTVPVLGPIGVFKKLIAFVTQVFIKS